MHEHREIMSFWNTQISLALTDMALSKSRFSLLIWMEALDLYLYDFIHCAEGTWSSDNWITTWLRRCNTRPASVYFTVTGTVYGKSTHGCTCKWQHLASSFSCVNWLQDEYSFIEDRHGDWSEGEAFLGAELKNANEECQLSLVGQKSGSEFSCWH